ncbi:MAG: hypothetical protein HKP32_09650 [Woeseia sp.]|nr:hypothetical protein [Woeseia sp.]NNL55405.1 hypothetical protein [Woeseia sp.]
MFKLFGLIRSNKKVLQPSSAASLLAHQNFGRGVATSIIVAIVAMILWVAVSLLFDRYFPWVSMLQGIAVGIAMQRLGRGLDWRFPLAAAIITALAAVEGSFLVALFLTGREFDTGALTLVDEISMHTVKTFLGREFGVVGSIYMLFAAALAAFYANRRLLPGEAVALRRHAAGESPATDLTTGANQ